MFRLTWRKLLLSSLCIVMNCNVIRKCITKTWTWLFFRCVITVVYFQNVFFLHFYIYNKTLTRRIYWATEKNTDGRRKWFTLWSLTYLVVWRVVACWLKFTRPRLMRHRWADNHKRAWGTQCKTGNDKRENNTWPVCPLSGQQLGLIPPKYPKWTLALRFSSRWY